MLLEKNVKELLMDVSSSAPTPGGGSVSALTATIASCLGIMVANLTIGKKKYENVQEEVEKIKNEMIFKLDNFISKYEEDSKAFDLVMDAFKLPKISEEDQIKRKAAIEEATIKASEVPLELLRLCNELIVQVVRLSEIGNQNSLSDAGVSLSLIRAAAEGAFLNVLINVKTLTNKSTADYLLNEATKLNNSVISLSESALGEIKRRLD